MNNNNYEVLVRTTEILYSLGLPATLKGFYHVRRAIILTVEDPDMIHPITRKLYPMVASEFEVTRFRVERDIRYGIEYIWNNGNIKRCEEIFGYTIDPEKGRPSNSHFISMVAEKIRREMKQQQLQ